MKIERILVPTNFSREATDALDRATALAVRRGAALRLLHAELLHEHDPHRVERERDAALQRVRRIVREWSGPGEPQRVRVEFESLRDVSAYDAIVHEIGTYDPQVVVMATRGGRLLLAGVAERVIRRKSCAVLTVRPGAQGNWPREGGPIVVPVDFSEPSRRALVAARSLADADSPIFLLHAVSAPHRSGAYPWSIPSPFESDPSLQTKVREHMRRWAVEPVDRVVAVEGHAKAAILEQCRELDAALVVVATRGHHVLPQSALGGTAERLVRSCAAPVLTVH